MQALTKKKLDYISLVILFVSLCNLVIAHFNKQVVFQPRHILGIIFLGITSISFFKNHKVGVLILGLTILLGLFGVLSFSPDIFTITLGKTIGDDYVRFLKFQPIFVLWTTIYFTLSGRYYIGILSKDYWKNFNEN